MTTDYDKAPMKPLTVRLPNDLRESFSREADAEHSSLGAQIRKALRDHVASHRKEP
jgi:predicted transcriptional regulator